MNKKLLVEIKKDTGRHDEAYHFDWWDKEGIKSCAYEDRLTLKELKQDFRGGGYKIKIIK